MIDSCLVIPTEIPYDQNTIKRALLTYDKVKLFAPDDRDFIPSRVYLNVRSLLETGIPVPIGLPVGPILPLGKTENYDSSFEQLLHDFSSAIRQGSLEVLSTTTGLNHFTLGLGSNPKEHPNPQFVYNAFRDITTKSEFVTAASIGINVDQILSEKNLHNLAPQGMEGGVRNGKFSLYGGQVGLDEKSRNKLESEEHQEVALAMCYARIGYLLKAISYCETEGVNAFTVDVGLARVINLLNRDYLKATQLVRTYTDENISESLSTLEHLIFKEHINSSALNQISPEQILKFRTKAWGRAYEKKSELKKTLASIASENENSSNLENDIKNYIETYIQECKDYEHERRKLGVKIFCGFGYPLLGTGGILNNSDLVSSIEETFNAPSVAAFYTIGSIGLTLLLKEGKNIVPQILDLYKRKNDLKELRGYTLFHPYKTLQNL